MLQVAEAAGQSGGVPALDHRFGSLVSAVAGQGKVGQALQVTVDDLQNQLNSVQNDMFRPEAQAASCADGDAICLSANRLPPARRDATGGLERLELFSQFADLTPQLGHFIGSVRRCPPM